MILNNPEASKGTLIEEMENVGEGVADIMSNLVKVNCLYDTF